MACAEILNLQSAFVEEKINMTDELLEVNFEYTGFSCPSESIRLSQKEMFNTSETLYIVS